jgi:hypothetical protein
MEHAAAAAEAHAPPPQDAAAAEDAAGASAAPPPPRMTIVRVKRKRTDAPQETLSACAALRPHAVPALRCARSHATLTLFSLLCSHRGCAAAQAPPARADGCALAGRAVAGRRRRGAGRGRDV